MPASTLNHLCLGSVFAWSCFNQPLMRTQGVLAQSSTDWSLGDVTLTFSLVMGGFAWGALFSKHLDRLGPRFCSLAGAASLGGGFTLVSVASHVHSLPLLYLGGLVWGVSNGIAYIPPVASLMRWFPHRTGFASGIVVCGYGGGALIAAPLFEALVKAFRRAPERLGSVQDVVLENVDGVLFTTPTLERKQVIVATLKDAMAWGEGLEPGVYVVGTGSTGASEAFLVLGALYAALMAGAAFTFRLPPPLAPTAFSMEKHRALELKTSGDEVGRHHHHHHHGLGPGGLTQSTYSIPFGLMYLGFACASTGAYAMISSSKLIVASSFPGIPPNVLTSFVAGTSIANLTGRLVYSNLSDYLAGRVDPHRKWMGRRETYSVMWSLAPLGFALVVGGINLNGGRGFDTAVGGPLVAFGSVCLGTFLVLSSFGGSSATRPAMVGDVFGTAHVAALSARQLSAVLPAAIVGPKLVAVMSDRAARDACVELAGKIPSDDAFSRAFGAGRGDLDKLIETKTVTVDRLVEVLRVQHGVAVDDPTPFLFNDALGVAAGLTVVALVVNRGVRPPLLPPVVNIKK